MMNGFGLCLYRTFQIDIEKQVMAFWPKNNYYDLTVYECE